MRAYRFTNDPPVPRVPGAAWGVALAETPTPSPGAGEVLVRIQASALNYVDLLMLGGMLPSALGLVPLLDGAGEVVAVGAGVSRFRPGDRVVASPQQNWIAGPASPEQGGHVLGCIVDGTLRDHGLFPETGLVAIPDSVSTEAAASLPCAGLSAWNTLWGGGRPLLPGDTLLTLGTGGVSMFAVQFAVASGIRVIATTSSAEKADRLRAIGADHVVNYAETPHWAPEVLKLTGGRGVDAVCEVAGAATLPQSLSAVRTGGKVALIGIVGGGQSGFDYNCLTLISQKVLTIFGNGMGSATDLAAMLRLVARAKIAPVIDRRFAFEDAAAAYAHFGARAHVGKVLIAH